MPIDNLKDHALSVDARARGRARRPCSYGFSGRVRQQGDTKARLERLLSSVTGNITQVSNVSLPGGGMHMQTLWQDFQFAVRMMRKNLGLPLRRCCA